MLKDTDERTANTKRAHLAQWLHTGNVIYKSVGVGLMDLSIGMHIVQFARGKGVGTHVQGF
jgi:ornithine cyclodeaminase/alanine dehydrogenase-like protein (mu-crystallin family)